MGKFKKGRNSKQNPTFEKNTNPEKLDKVKNEQKRTEENMKSQEQAKKEWEENNKNKVDIIEETKEEQEEIVEETEENPNKFLIEEDIEDKRKVIIVLAGCMLEVAKIHKQEVLLNSDEHKGHITNKLNRDFSIYRPDVVHHSLLSLMDSPLNKAGLLQVYIHTEQNVLIEINPNCKIPRTYKRFAALMVQLLNKLRIRAVQSSETLLKVIKNPMTDHLPFECLKIGTSCKGRLVNMNDFVKKIPKNKPICFVVGGVSKGNPGGECEYVDEVISCSKYSLSAGYCLGRIMGAFETLWDIL